MTKQKLSFEMSVEDHKNLKACCAIMGVSIKDFVTEATIEKVKERQLGLMSNGSINIGVSL